VDVNGATEPAVELSGAELRRSLAILRRAIDQRAEREPVCSCKWVQVDRWSAFGHVIEERYESVVDPGCSIHGRRS
jgi:hypothetical protein